MYIVLLYNHKTRTEKDGHYVNINLVLVVKNKDFHYIIFEIFFNFAKERIKSIFFKERIKSCNDGNTKLGIKSSEYDEAASEKTN